MNGLGALFGEMSRVSGGSRGAGASKLSRTHGLENTALEIGDGFSGDSGDSGLGPSAQLFVHVIANGAVAELFLDEDRLLARSLVSLGREQWQHRGLQQEGPVIDSEK